MAQGQPPVPPGERPVPPGQRPVPPGQRPVPPGQRPPQAQRAGGRPEGPGGFPPTSDESGGPFGSRRNLILAIVAAVVLIPTAIGIGFLVAKPDEPASAPPSVPISSAPVSQSPVTTPTATSADALPVGPPLGQNQIVVPMRTADDKEGTRPLYLVDAERNADSKGLPGPDGRIANPMLQKERTSIIFLEGGVLHVMASDGSGERDLADRDPAGCDRVAGASWSRTDPDTMVISCQLSSDNFRMAVVNVSGRLVRHLAPGRKRFDDVTLSPDGQTVLYWASNSSAGDGGALYTLPLVGTGEPKRITSGTQGLDGDPAWSPDGSQIAFRRLVGGVGGNADVYVMNADGSDQRVVADTPAADIKPVWSPDGKDLLIVSNRKSTNGSAGKTWDLWLTRASDGEVMDRFDLAADEITTPTWTYR